MPRRRGLRPPLLAAVLRSNAILAFAAERQVVMRTEAMYPFVPKSTAVLRPGQYWAVPLPDGRFACGRVVQVGCSTIPTPSRAFFGGLHHWIGAAVPSAEDIAGRPIVAWGVMHIRAIANLGGEVLGERDL